MTDVRSKNLFELLGDDGDADAPIVAPAPAQQQKEQPKKPQQQVQKSEKADAKKAAPRNEYPRRGGYGGQQPRGGGDNANRVSRPPRGDRTDSGDVDRPPREQNGERAPYRGDRPRRGRGAGAGGRGREFDRRSANPRYDGEKKDVAGKGTWGDATTAEQAAASDAAAEAPAADGAAPETPAEENKAEGEETPKEPEEVVKTLEQYLAEKAAKAAPELNVRKANEGADESQWKDAKVFKRVEEDDVLGLAKEKVKKSSTKQKAEKVFAPIEQRFADEQRASRGGRGGRGRGGESRGDRAPRGGKRQGFVNVEDTTAFPSLGGK